MVGISLSHPQNEARVWGSRHSWPSSTCTVTTQYFRTDDYNDLVITWNSSQFINECRMQLLFCANKAMQICTFISMAVGYPKLSLPQTPPLKQILSELAYCLKLIHEKSCLIYLCEQLSELEDPTCSNLYPLIHPCQSRATVLLSLSLSLSFISIPGSRQPHRFEPALWSLGTGPFLTSSLKQCTNLGHVQFPKLRAIWMCQTRSESWITAKYVFDFFLSGLQSLFFSVIGCKMEQLLWVVGGSKKKNSVLGLREQVFLSTPFSSVGQHQTKLFFISSHVHYYHSQTMLHIKQLHTSRTFATIRVVNPMQCITHLALQLLMKHGWQKTLRCVKPATEFQFTISFLLVLTERLSEWLPW